MDTTHVTDLNETPKPRVGGPITSYVVLVLVILGIAALWINHRGSEGRAVAMLPREERAQLYLRTLEDIRFCKTAAAQDLKGFCERQAEFILTFPECGEECKATSRLLLTGPQR